MVKQKKEEDAVLEMLFFVVAGLIGVCVTFLPLAANVVVTSLFVGISLLIVGVVIGFNFLRVNDKKLRENKSGALYIWAVCLLAIVVLALGWFSLTWPTMMIIDMIEGLYDFPAEAVPAINLIKSVLGWFLILMSLGLLLWAYVNSQRREDVTYPM